MAQEYIQLQLYKSDKARISQSLALHCNWRVDPWISVGQMLYVHVYDRTAWKPHIFFQMFGPIKGEPKADPDITKRGARNGFWKKIRG